MSFPPLPRSRDLASPGPAALVVVGVDWCGHCQTLKHDLRNYTLPRGVRVYWVDGDTDARAQGWNIDGYPTIMYNASQGGLWKHTGARTQAGITRLINSVERQNQ